MSDPIHTVEFAARRLGLHPKTVLRFIRDGRLPATRIGKAYRIRHADLEALVGTLPGAAPPPAPQVTAIVELVDVGPERARKFAHAVTNALRMKPPGVIPMRADVVHEPDQARVKIIIVGSPSDAANLLGLIDIWSKQLT